MTKYGRLELITGPMCSGKSTELIRRLESASYEFDERKVLAVRHAADTRGQEGWLTSRLGARVRAITATDSDAVATAVLQHHARVVAVDEAQFYDDGIVAVADMLANRGVRVICAGLDVHCNGGPFGPVPALMAIADDVVKLHAFCTRCPTGLKRRAVRTQYVGSDTAPVGGEIRPGGAELYEPRCRACFTPTVDATAPTLTE